MRLGPLWFSSAVIAGVLAASAAIAAAQPVTLTATVHFDRTIRPGERINKNLLGLVNGVNSAILPGVDKVVQKDIRPPFIRADVGFEDSGCPDNPNAGPLYNPTDNSFNYCTVDQRIEQALAVHARPLMIIDYMPPPLGVPACVASNGNGFGNHICPPADHAKFSALVEAMMVHVYRKFKARDFEVWNEPDLPIFFDGQLSDYLAIYEDCNAALLAAEKQLHLRRGTLHLGGPATFIDDQNFIEGVMADAVSNPDLRVDFISWHYYANYLALTGQDPSLAADIYGDLTRQVQGYIAPYLAERTDLHPKLWIDEWNVNSFYDPRMSTAYDGAFEVAAMHSMQDAGLDRSCRYNTADGSANSATTGNFGIFTFDDGARPVLYGIEMWRDLAPRRVEVEATGDTDLSHYTQNLIASIGPHAATVLIYNFIPYSPLDQSAPYCGDGGAELDATLTLTGLKNGAHKVTMRQFDCSTGILPIAEATLTPTSSTLNFSGHQAALPVTVPADGAILITIAR
ncbi:MAG: GH39 family glycosyl hydrolase [Candidatus Binataceae bacterium]